MLRYPHRSVQYNFNPTRRLMHISDYFFFPVLNSVRILSGSLLARLKPYVYHDSRCCRDKRRHNVQKPQPLEIQHAPTSLVKIDRPIVSSERVLLQGEHAALHDPVMAKGKHGDDDSGIFGRPHGVIEVRKKATKAHSSAMARMNATPRMYSATLRSTSSLFGV